MVLRTIIHLLTAVVKLITAVSTKAISLIVENTVDRALFIRCKLPSFQQATYVVFCALYLTLRLWNNNPAAAPKTSDVAKIFGDVLLGHLGSVLDGISSCAIWVPEPLHSSASSQMLLVTRANKAVPARTAPKTETV